ncbi:hypothetical protein [Pseudonocardia xishanensis]|uniref:hypothetical protein n=1 Tax=Pseudonocardia xishanensis TaxID=630995 RepID=UPI0031F02C46
MTRSGTRRKEAADVARRLLQDKVDQVAQLAELGTKVDDAEAAVEAATTALALARQDYAVQYRAAIAAGWTDDHLAEAGCSADRGGAPTKRARSRRRQPEPAGTPVADSEIQELPAAG